MSTILKWLLVGVAVLFLCVIAGAIGSSIVPNAPNSTYDITYADFIVIMLTAVAVIVTVLALIVAVAAFVGWQSFDARVKAEVASILKRGFEPGQPLHKLFSEQRDRANVAGVQPIGVGFEDDAREESKTEGEY